MSEVTRFDLVTKGRGFDTWQKMEADPDGEWVKAEDYAAMAEHAAMVEMERDALRAEVERLKRIEELALIWAAYQDDESKANPDLLMQSLDAADALYDAVSARLPDPTPAALVGRMDLKRFEKAPCYICGYNGPNYYQAEVHECAGLYHEQTNEMP